MAISLSNGCIVNTCAALVLFLASSFNFSVSCTYILAPCLLMIRKTDKGKPVNKYKALKAVIFALLIIILSAAASVMTSWMLLWLDYKGPNHEVNNAWY
jgi:phosphate/sulfate permease